MFFWVADFVLHPQVDSSESSRLPPRLLPRAQEAQHLLIDPLGLFHIVVGYGVQGVCSAHQLVEVDADPINGINE